MYGLYYYFSMKRNGVVLGHIVWHCAGWIGPGTFEQVRLIKWILKETCPREMSIARPLCESSALSLDCYASNTICYLLMFTIRGEGNFIKFVILTAVFLHLVLVFYDVYLKKSRSRNPTTITEYRVTECISTQIRLVLIVSPNSVQNCAALCCCMISCNIW